MPEFVTGTAYTVQVATDGAGGTALVDLGCVLTNFDETMNELMDTFSTLCTTVTNTVKTGVDVEWACTAKGDKLDPALLYILSLKYEVGLAAVTALEIADTLAGQTITGDVTVGGISITAESPTVLEISFTLKPYDGQITETPIV